MTTQTKSKNQNDTSERLTIVLVDERREGRMSTWQRLRNWHVLLFAIFGWGILADSAAMQWLGFIIGLVAVPCAIWKSTTGEAMSVDQAITRLRSEASEANEGEGPYL